MVFDICSGATLTEKYFLPLLQGLFIHCIPVMKWGTVLPRHVVTQWGKEMGHCITQTLIVTQLGNERVQFITQTLKVTKWGNLMGCHITQTLIFTHYGNEMGQCIT